MTRDYSKYGITVRQWNVLFKRQKSKCPICLRPIFKPGNKDGRKAAAVDHDHKTQRVRGLLCFQCNKYRVGNLTAEYAKRIAEYLSSDFDGRTL